MYKLLHIPFFRASCHVKILRRLVFGRPSRKTLSPSYGSHLYYPLDLEEPSQPPDLEERFANDNTDDEDIPPLDSTVGALGRVAVGALADDDIRLLVLDLSKELRQLTNC